MTKAKARALLRSAGYKHLDPWIEEQPWRPMPGGTCFQRSTSEI